MQEGEGGGGGGGGGRERERERYKACIRFTVCERVMEVSLIMKTNCGVETKSQQYPFFFG